MINHRIGAEPRAHRVGLFGRFAGRLAMIVAFGLFLVVGALVAGAFVVSILVAGARVLWLTRGAAANNDTARPTGRILDAEYQVLTPTGRESGDNVSDIKPGRNRDESC